MFLLCTFVDQGRWTSAFEPLLYPTGLSFYRPFSYRQRYFQPEGICDLLSDPVTARQFLKDSAKGYFGIRFHDESAPDHQNRFIPLREVSLSAVERGDGMNLFFRLGAYLVPGLVNGKSSFPTLDITHLVGDVKQMKLFIQTSEEEASAAARWQTADEFPGNVFWDAFEQALSEPAKAKVKDAMVIRLVRTSGRGGQAALEAEDIDPSRHLWGYRLRERNIYDLVLSYYRILPSDGVNARTHQGYCIGNPREELRSSRSRIPITGNYRSEDLWVSPLVPMEAPVHVSLEPCTASDSTHDKNTTDEKMIGLKLPVVVDSADWPTLRKANLLIALVSLAAALFALRTYLLADEGTQKVLLVLIAALMSLAANGFKDVIAYRK